MKCADEAKQQRKAAKKVSERRGPARKAALFGRVPFAEGSSVDEASYESHFSFEAGIGREARRRAP